jgi:hypothetical protein
MFRANVGVHIPAPWFAYVMRWENGIIFHGSHGSMGKKIGLQKGGI